ncbi:hypothetical protein F8568_002510 [Actinomadura sp. LD22]|uniref:Uncharacterized protein n=1 Tax=Actinomadura physcomitrii TaxID=2650748 RepID=A0A6I4M543_9ACTN|nr:hypothetical protein [Actinomadura physcomitrii]MVZ99276.1 hypothetical protein [Actinomadura physcomitrii]
MEPIFELPLNEVEVMIGEALLADGFGAKDANDAEKRLVARRWFQANMEAFRAAVCGSGSVVAGANKDRNALLGALVDVLGSRFGVTVPVAAVSVMIMHYGVDRLCAAPGGE